MSIAYTPLDLPKIPYSEEIYWEFFRKDCMWKDITPDFTKDVEEKRLRQRNISENLIIRTTDELYKGEDSHSVRLVKGREYYWTESVINELPEFVIFLEQLPINLTYVSFTTNSIYIYPHRDIRIRDFNKSAIEQMHKDVKGYEPSCYRCFLSDNGRNDSFFVATSEDDNNQESVPLTPVNIVTTKMPEDTDTFIFNYTEHWHGAYVPPEPKLLLFMDGFIKPKEHLELIQRSVKKYPEYVVSF